MGTRHSPIGAECDGYGTPLFAIPGVRFVAGAKVAAAALASGKSRRCAGEAKVRRSIGKLALQARRRIPGDAHQEPPPPTRRLSIPVALDTAKRW